ncbi:unnamed protein product [Gadus morhua 'NCC']
MREEFSDVHVPNVPNDPTFTNTPCRPSASALSPSPGLRETDPGPWERAPAGLLQFDQHQHTLNHKEHNNPDTPPARGSSPDLIAQRGFTMTALPHSSTVKLDLGRIQSS